MNRFAEVAGTPAQASAEVRDLIHRMLNPDTKARITVPDIMAHPWFMTDLPAGVTDLNETLLATAAAAEVDAYDATVNGSSQASGEGDRNVHTLKCSAPLPAWSCAADSGWHVEDTSCLSTFTNDRSYKAFS